MKLLTLLVAAGFVAPFPSPLPGKPLPPGGVKPDPIMPKGPVEIFPDCSGTLTVNLPAASPGVIQTKGDKDIGDRGRWDVTAAANFTKTRIHVFIEAVVRERGGDTNYTGFRNIWQQVDVPSGCEIATMNRGTGKAKLDHDGRGFETVTGSGLIAEATCSADTHDQFVTEGCRSVTFRPIEVTMRPLRKDCADVVVRPTKLAVVDVSRPYRYRNGAPIWDVVPREYGVELGGERPTVGLRAWAAVHHDNAWRSLGKVMLHLRMHISSPTPPGVDGDLSREVATELFDPKLDAPGCKVDGIDDGRGSLGGRTKSKPDHEGSLYGHPNSTNLDPSREGILTGAWCVTDSDGLDNGKVGCPLVTSRPIAIQLSPE